MRLLQGRYFYARYLGYRSRKVALPCHLIAGLVVGEQIRKGGIEMKEIPLTQGQVALVDDDDFEKICQFKWCAAKYTHLFYATSRYRDEEGKYKNIKMHRLILNAKPNEIVDHIDGNGLNNQKSNLRIVSRRQNAQNRHRPKSSQYPGVYWNKEKQKWNARINYGHKCVRLGYFKNEIDAFRAYYDEVLKLGEEVIGFPYPHKTRDAIYLLIGPSGSGKTTLAQHLKELGIPELVSHTTRLMRPGEVQGKTYYFVKFEDFEQIEMIEQTKYNHHLYGTSKQEVERVLSSSGSAFAIVDRHGIEQYKAIYGDLVKAIYVWVPAELAIERMIQRGDDEDSIADRIKHAFRSGEFDNLDIADYCIVNKDLEASGRQLEAIVREAID